MHKTGNFKPKQAYDIEIAKALLKDPS